MRLEVKVKGNVARVLAKIPKEAEAIMEEEIAAAIVDIEREAVMSAPSDLGALRASIKGDSKGMEGAVSVGVNYAPYVEFGTGGKVDVPVGLEDYAIQFKGKGIRQVNLPARPFLFPAFFNQTEKMLDSMKRALSDINI